MKHWRKSSRWRKARANVQTIRHAGYLESLARGQNPFKFGNGMVRAILMADSMKVIKAIHKTMARESPFLTALRGTARIAKGERKR